MNHTSIVSLSKPLASTVDYLNTKYPPIPLNIAEFGSALNPGFNHFELESVLGAALWQVDFMLWLLAIGVNRAHIQLGIGFGFAPWQPVEYRSTPAKVNAPYYAHVLIADFIGHSRKMQVVNIDMESDTLSAYAAYDDGMLSKVAVVNLEMWSHMYSDPDGRPSLDVRVEVPAEVKFVEGRRLTSPLGATASDSKTLTWAGMSWSWESHGMGRYATDAGEEVQIFEVKAGIVDITISASEALVLSLIR